MSNKCEATGKVIFRTEALAQERLRNIKYNSNKRSGNKKHRGDGKVKRAYHCDSCKGYHLTSYDKYTPNQDLITKLKYREQFKKYLSND